MYIVNRDYICEQIEVQVEVTYTAPFRIADLIEGTIEKDIIDMRYSRAGSAYAKPTLDTRPFRVGRDPPPGTVPLLALARSDKLTYDWRREVFLGAHVRSRNSYEMPTLCARRSERLGNGWRRASPELEPRVL